MKTNKINLNIGIIIFLFFIISILSIYCANSFLSPSLGNLYFKQFIFYLIGIIITIIVTYKGFNLFKKYHFLIYIGINILLLALLFFGKVINGSRCWFFIGPISFQPSELMKISLIFTISTIINKFKLKYKNPTMKDEFTLLLKLLLIIAIPSILTLLEPDTGVVIIYFIILITLIFMSGINKKWYIIFSLTMLSLITTFILLYLFHQDILVKILGTDIFYRLDRIFNWADSSGYQLENSLIAIGSSGLLGFGFNNNPVYFPEPQTDFIFTTYTANFGFLGSVFLILLITTLNSTLLNLATKKIRNIDKLIIIGIFSSILYQQIQNIAMTIGLLPITGITLPFISYGGSSLLSYMFIVGIIMNINRERLKYRN